MADPAVPSPWPGAHTAPTVITKQVAQGVISGDTTAKLNEISQVEKGLVWYRPQITPFLRLLTKLKRAKSVSNARFYHLEKQAMPRTATIDGITGDATTVTGLSLGANEANRFRPNDLLYNLDTGDIALVSTITDGDDITVVSNIGVENASGTLWAVGNKVLNIGNAYVDGSGAGSPIHVVEDERMFVCQIFKDAIEQSDRYQKTDLYEGDPWTNARRAAEQEHTLSIENAMFFGKPSIAQDAATGKLRTTMGGLAHYINENVVDLSGGGVLSKAYLHKILVESMRLGNSGYENKEMATKTLLCGVNLANKLNAIAEAQIRITEPSAKTFGLRVAQYQGAWGVLNILQAPALNQAGTNDFAFIVDFEHLRPANFKGRDTRFQSDIQAVDADAAKGQYISDKSMVVEVVPAHTKFTGVSSLS